VSIKNSTLEKNAPLVATFLSLMLAIVKLSVGVISGSVALLASAIDSIMDMFISIINFLALKVSDRKPNDNYQYGYGKLEAIVTTIEGVLIFGSGIYIIYEAINNYITKEVVTYLELSIFVMVFSIVTVFVLVQFLSYVVKKSNNLVIKADLLHYKTDLYSNAAVLFTLLVVYLSGLDWVDSLFGILIGAYIIKESMGLIKEGLEVLLDRSLETNEVKAIEDIFVADKGVEGFHFLKTRYAGKYKFVEVHLVIDRDISLMDAHIVSDRIEGSIQDLDKSKNWHIMIHLDPVDDSDGHIF
jgi:cation diffusion facilitator family transporter